MKKILAIVTLFAPAAAMAQTHQVTEVNSLTNWLLGLGNTVIYILVSLAVIFIVWHIVMYIVGGADPAAKKAHLGNVGWGILGLAIIVSIWGLVGILTRSFVTTPTNQAIPNLGNITTTGGQPANQNPVQVP